MLLFKLVVLIVVFVLVGFFFCVDDDENMYLVDMNWDLILDFY